MLVDTGVAPDPREVAWINPKIKPGERRKVVTGIPGKTGIVYTLDRADRRVPVGAADGLAERACSKIDGATGEVTVNPETLFTAIGESGSSARARNGGKNWPAGAYSPLTNAMYSRCRTRA